MKCKKHLIVILGLIVLSFGSMSIIESFAESNSIESLVTASTDKSLYSNGDLIKISGHVQDYSKDIPVSMIVTSPTGSIVALKEIDVSPDGNYNTILSNTDLMKKAGTYTVNVQYKDQSNTAQTTFYFQGISDNKPTFSSFILIPGYDYKIHYLISHGDVIGISSNMVSQSLILSVNSQNPDNLIVELPRALIDAKIGDIDDVFFVLIDQKETPYNEVFTSLDHRILEILLPSGSKEVEIVGTFVSAPSPVLSAYEDIIPPKILKPTDITVKAQNSQGANVTFDVLAIDETDDIIVPLCNPESGSMFLVGKTKVTCTAIDRAENKADAVSFYVTVTTQTAIPDWVRNVALFWCSDKIDDSSFIEGIQYLIDNDIIQASIAASSNDSQGIPSWIKINACWWSEGLVSDDEFVKAIQYLTQQGLIVIQSS